MPPTLAPNRWDTADDILQDRTRQTWGQPVVLGRSAHHSTLVLHLPARLRACARHPQPRLDDFKACRIERAEDIKSLCADCFYFGCEAEDHALAFNERNNPFGARLYAFFGSDIGHFDVQDMASDLPEA